MNANAGTQFMLLTISVRDYCTFLENQRLHLNSFNFNSFDQHISSMTLLLFLSILLYHNLALAVWVSGHYSLWQAPTMTHLEVLRCIMMTVCSPLFHHPQQQRDTKRETVRVRGCKSERERDGSERNAERPGVLSVCSVMIWGVMNFQTLCIRGVTLRIALTVSDFCPVSVRWGPRIILLPSTPYQLLRLTLPT